MFWSLFFYTIGIAFALFGLVCAVELIVEAFFPDRRIFTVVEIRSAKDAKVLDLLPAHTALLGASNFIREIEKLSKTIRIPATLREAGVDMDLYRASKDEIIRAALADACTATNPRTPSKEEVVEIFKKIW